MWEFVSRSGMEVGIDVGFVVDVVVVVDTVGTQ